MRFIAEQRTAAGIGENLIRISVGVKFSVDIIADLGGRSVGTQFAILTYREQDDPARRAEAVATAAATVATATTRMAAASFATFATAT